MIVEEKIAIDYSLEAAVTIIKGLDTNRYKTDFIIHCMSYLTHIEEYMERDIFYLYTMSPLYHG